MLFQIQRYSTLFNPTQDGGGWKGQEIPTNSFFSVTLTNAGIIPGNVVTFSFNTFATLV